MQCYAHQCSPIWMGVWSGKLRYNLEHQAISNDNPWPNVLIVDLELNECDDGRGSSSIVYDSMGSTWH